MTEEKEDGLTSRKSEGLSEVRDEEICLSSNQIEGSDENGKADSQV